MKINLGKLAKVLGQIVVAAPVVIAALKPVVDAAKKRKRQVGKATEESDSLDTAALV